jgi:hypothetical protein
VYSVSIRPKSAGKRHTPTEVWHLWAWTHRAALSSRFRN